MVYLKVFEYIIPNKNTFNTILITGLVAGTLDGLVAVMQFMINGGKNPEINFKYIASAVFGKKAAKSAPHYRRTWLWHLCMGE